MTLHWTSIPCEGEIVEIPWSFHADSRSVLFSCDALSRSDLQGDQSNNRCVCSLMHQVGLVHRIEMTVGLTITWKDHLYQWRTTCQLL